MALKCDNCHKGIMVGKQHKHHAGVAGGRWRKRAPVTQKIFSPNLHSARIVINGVGKRMKLCTKCLRILKGTKKVEVQTPIVSETPEAPVAAA